MDISVRYNPETGEYFFVSGDRILKVSEEEYEELMSSLNGISYNIQLERKRRKKEEDYDEIMMS